MTPQEILKQIKETLIDFQPVPVDGKDGLLISWKGNEIKNLEFKLSLTKIIWPTREGELIEDVTTLPSDISYKLTYPGTASTKSMVLYTDDQAGILVIARPTITYAQLELQRLPAGKFAINIQTTEHAMIMLPFVKEWQSQLTNAYTALGIPSPSKRNHCPVKLFLQLGAKDSFGNVHIKHFEDLKKPIDYFVNEVGSGHLVHFFGTNEAGFDRMFPDYSIAKSLGGINALKEIVSYAQNKGLLTSHHYVPRIADSNWIKQHPEFLDATIKDAEGKPIKELYKDHPFYVMNPNNQQWFDQCRDTIHYLSSVGFDYLELDQFIYQRNFQIANNIPLHVGYNKLFDVCEEVSIKYWLEGICDAYKLSVGNFFQILVRDRAQMWHNHENRRGYPYGKSHPELIMSLRPDAEISYQVMTENTNTVAFSAKLEIAREIHADLYDLQMSFYNDKYMPLLKTVLGHIKESMSDQIYSASTKWHANSNPKAPEQVRGKKIGICHYSIGKTDGVSLEIDKRKEMLISMGYDVKLIAGSNSEGADYVIPELDFNRENIVRIKENAFFALKDFNTDKELETEIDRISAIIEDTFLQIQEKEKFDYLFLHNIFSHGRHIAAAKAFTNVGEKTKIQLIAVSHDFYSAGSYTNIYKPTTDWVRQYLSSYVPPPSSKIKHVTINSLNKSTLKKKSGLNSLVIPDTFNFSQKPWHVDAYNSTLLNDINVRPHDLFVLQATRIVERKAIELAVDLVTHLNKRKTELIGRVLYNGKRFTDDSKIVLVLAGYTEHASMAYKKKLEDLIQETNIEARFIHDHIDTWRGQKEDSKLYSLWDCYVYADLVTYPSVWEGWGNQFIEAIFAKKPVALFEYPVFTADIKPEGYDVISLGNQLAADRPNGLVTVPPDNLKKATEQTIEVLINPRTTDILDKNFIIGKKYHDDEVLRDLLTQILNSDD